ncbi:MAG: alpha amylase C-terminal domain-containing protein [Alistipes sp.]|nr:alpha amylase C-terminal domain-containing protein [Candidatus Alistipes equi]
MEKQLKIVEQDDWLKPVSHIIERRHAKYLSKMDDIQKTAGTIVNYANGYRYFGWNFDDDLDGWWFREWLPEAEEVYLFGDFNDWHRDEIRLEKDNNGIWSTFLPRVMYEAALEAGSLYKIQVKGKNGIRERIPAYARYVVQDEVTKNFTAKFVEHRGYDWKTKDFTMPKSLFIYETHIGMAQEKAGIGTYAEFQKNILPIIRDAGYNAIQVMALAEHPYYGSFGYHVSSFFAPSSRFGSAEELKELIDTAHSMGIAVIMDLVHAHYIKNLNEGINELDGSDHLYSKSGDEGYQKYWDSKTFDYGKREVQHFLLSNIKYWIEEFHIDGYRFDGVTSMIYNHHGYTEFDCREKYFNEEVNEDALVYLSLANKLIHELKANAVTIAEDVSGMPGMCHSLEDGGYGFDYRLAMAIPDFWIRLLKDENDEQWDIGQMWEIMTSRLEGVGTVAYCESHDQAMVGDQTLAFRLMDKEMYYSMDNSSESIVIDRGIALHKMIRLFTISTGGNAYLNFMGNEFGHPEWIDFPRQGNDWSYEHARRQWSLSKNGFLRYGKLQEFDRQMINLIKEYRVLEDGYPYLWKTDYDNKTVVYSHSGLIFIFNWHPTASIPNYEIEVPWPGKYTIALSTEDKRFGGLGRVDNNGEYFTETRRTEDKEDHFFIKVYNVSRSAIVLKL